MIKRIAFPFLLFHYSLSQLQSEIGGFSSPNSPLSFQGWKEKGNQEVNQRGFLHFSPPSRLLFFAKKIVLSWLFLAQQILFCSPNATPLSRRGIFPFSSRFRSTQIPLIFLSDIGTENVFRSPRNEKSEIIWISSFLKRESNSSSFHIFTHSNDIQTKSFQQWRRKKIWLLLPFTFASFQPP